MFTPMITCSACPTPASDLTAWRCAACGSPLEITNLPPFNPDQINLADHSLWRYAAMLPAAKQISLGEGSAPIIDARIGVDASYDGVRFRAALEYLNPTGSYKDRGTVLVVNHLLAQGVREVVEDSSGNAGSSLAMYASLAGMRARIFTPAGAVGAKKKQIGMAGEAVGIPGPRQAVTDAVIAAAQEPGVVYASHAWSPFFIAGQMTLAWDIWLQNGRRAPGAVAMPVGMGCLLLGVYRGFVALLNAGLITTVPRLYAVQTEASDPIVRAWETGADDVPPIETQRTVADGIVIAKPVRSKALLKAIRASGGAAFRVPEAAILPARDALARRGLLVEPTSATTVAALPQLRQHYQGDDLTIVFTGHGLKTIDVGL